MIRGGAGIYWTPVPISALPGSERHYSARKWASDGIVECSTKHVPRDRSGAAGRRRRAAASWWLHADRHAYKSDVGPIRPITQPADPGFDPAVLTHAAKQWANCGFSRLMFSNPAPNCIRGITPLPRSYQMSIGVQRDLGQDMVLTADYSRKITTDLRSARKTSITTIDFVRRSPVSCDPSVSHPDYTPGVECSNGPITFWVDGGPQRLRRICW